MRIFNTQSILTDGNLALALAPALTPTGIDNNPHFLRGFVEYPQVLARGLLVLVDVTSTRYYNYAPVPYRDPILSAQGDRLRAECFSACNGVYARLDLFQSGLHGEISFGTTNVDIGAELRTALTRVKQKDKLHINIGGDGFTAARISTDTAKSIRLEEKVNERPVQMPDRWVQALGNAAEIHRIMKPVFTLTSAGAQGFVMSLPIATGKHQGGWLLPAGTGVTLSPRPSHGAVYVSGLHRLSSLKRIMTNILSMTFYGPVDGEGGPFMAEVELPCARLTLSLTAEAWHGYSGEGALLHSLAKQEVLEDAESISSVLGFESKIDEMQMASRWNMNGSQIQDALALLAVSGKLGFDVHDQTYYHRELPDESTRVLKDNPRLVAAQKLVDKVTNIGENKYMVSSNEWDYRVYFPSVNEAKCTCAWYLNHQNKRGPCKHILAVQLKEATP